MLSLKENGRPSFQFYPDDWLRDTGLRLCSLQARGLWIEMLCIMFYGKPRGTLTVNGKAIEAKGLAKILGVRSALINKLLNELEANKVFSRLADSTIYCRRMYRDAQKDEYLRKVRSDAGKRGAQKRWGSKIGNGNSPLAYAKTTSNDNTLSNKGISQIATSPSSSVSSSTSNKNSFDNGKDSKEKSGMRRGRPTHVSELTQKTLNEARQQIKHTDPALRRILTKKLDEIESEGDFEIKNQSSAAEKGE